MSQHPVIFNVRDLSIDDGIQNTPVSHRISVFPDCDKEWSDKLQSILDSVDFLPSDKLYASSDQVSFNRVSSHTDDLNHARRAAQAHLRIRKEIMKLKPNTPYNFICTLVEQMTSKMLKNEKNDGLGFPTGISVNDCAAHYSSNLSTGQSESKVSLQNHSNTSYGENSLSRNNLNSNKYVTQPENESNVSKNSPKQSYLQNISYNMSDKKSIKEIIQPSDVVKIDYGCHSNGFIIDSAFTLIYDDKYQNIADAAKESTYKGIEYMGVDCFVSEIGREISEVISSYELEINGETVPIQAVKNLNGHSIRPFTIHGGISIPNIYDPLNDQRIKSDSFYALETFATTGNGYVREGPNTTHFMIGSRNTVPSDPFNKKIWQIIKTHISTLPFSQRFIKRLLLNDSNIVIEENQNNLHGKEAEQKVNQINTRDNNINNQKNCSTTRPKKLTLQKKKGKFIFSSQHSLNESIRTAISSLTALRILEPHPPLYDNIGSRVGQFEHTLWIDERGKEILSKGEDY